MHNYGREEQLSLSHSNSATPMKWAANAPPSQLQPKPANGDDHANQPGGMPRQLTFNLQSQLSSSRLSGSNNTITVGLGSERKRLPPPSQDQAALINFVQNKNVPRRQVESPSFEGDKVNVEYSGSSVINSQSMLTNSAKDDEQLAEKQARVSTFSPGGMHQRDACASKTKPMEINQSQYLTLNPKDTNNQTLMSVRHIAGTRQMI